MNRLSYCKYKKGAIFMAHSVYTPPVKGH